MPVLTKKFNPSYFFSFILHLGVWVHWPLRVMKPLSLFLKISMLHFWSKHGMCIPCFTFSVCRHTPSHAFLPNFPACCHSITFSLGGVYRPRRRIISCTVFCWSYNLIWLLGPSLQLCCSIFPFNDICDFYYFFNPFIIMHFKFCGLIHLLSFEYKALSSDYRVEWASTSPLTTTNPCASGDTCKPQRTRTMLSDNYKYHTALLCHVDVAIDYHD